MIGETLRKSVTLVNRGALGTKVEFYKISGDVAIVFLPSVSAYPVPMTSLEVITCNIISPGFKLIL